MTSEDQLKLWNDLSDAEKASLLFLFGIQLASLQLAQYWDDIAWINHHNSIQPSLESSSATKFTAHNYRKLEKHGFVERKPLNQRQQQNDIEIHLTSAGWSFMYNIISNTTVVSDAREELERFMLQKEESNQKTQTKKDSQWDKLTKRQQDFLIAAAIVTDWQKNIITIDPSAVLNSVPFFGRNYTSEIEDWQWINGNAQSCVAMLLIPYDPAYKPDNPHFHAVSLQAKGFNSTWRSLVNLGYMDKVYNFGTNHYYITAEGHKLLTNLQNKKLLGELHQDGKERFLFYDVAYDYAHHNINKK